MPNHMPGDMSQPEKTTGEILSEAPVVDSPIPSEQGQFRQIYASTDRSDAYSKANVHIQGGQAKGGYGFYGEHFGNSLYAPPIEFGGYGGGLGGGQAYWSGTDAFSSPGRYQMGGFGGGYMGKEGWVYGRGGHTNVDHMRIAQSILLYKTEGIVQRIVHLLADFVVENVDIIHPDLTVSNFYKSWAIKVALKDRLHRFVVDLLTTGNVFVWTKLANLKPSDSRDMKKGIAAELIGDDLVVSLSDADGKRLRDKVVSVEVSEDIISKFKTLKDACEQQATAGRVNEVIKKAEGDTRNDPVDPQNKPRATQIPWKYISLNPLQMEPRGSRFANEHHWVMLIHERDMRPLSKFMSYRHYTDITTTQVNLPEVFKGKLRPMNRGGTPYAAELQLDEKRLSVIQDVTKADYEDWATPHIYPANKEVQFKRMLRQGEISAMESLKHMITLIKLGKVEDGYIPTEEQIERVAAALAGGSQAHHLIWDDLIEGQVLQPNIGNIFDPKKYQQVDKDIYAALGVAESVFSGNASYANSFMAIKLLLEKLETIREKLEGWLRVELKDIAEVMKFKRLPSIRWGLMSLRDENAERKLFLDLFDRGMLSKESLLERFGTDFDIELERQKLEAEIVEQNNKGMNKQTTDVKQPVMVDRGPFVRENKAQLPQGTQGRPGGTGTPQTKKRNTKPKGMGAIVDFQKFQAYASDAIREVSSVITDLVVKNNSLKDARSMTKAQKIDTEELIIKTLVKLNPSCHEVISPDLVYDLMDAELVDNSTKILSVYEQELNSATSKEERFELITNAFAAVHANLLEE